MRATVRQLAAFACVWCLWALLPHGAASACSCDALPTPQEAREKASAVFLGLLEKFELLGNLDLSAGGQTAIQWSRVATFSVRNVWKGPEKTSIEVTTGFRDEDCGYDFIVGRDYVVYASGPEGALRTSVCDRTRGAGQAGDDLGALGPGTPPSNTGQPATP